MHKVVKWYDESKNKWLTEQEAGELSEDYMCIWGTNINIARAIPDVRDGCKPIVRRMLYSTYITCGNKYFKVASATGDVLHLSPHGDASINEAFNQLAQTFNNNVCLYNATGNAGTVLRGDDGAAPRYLTMKLSKFAQEVFFDDFDKRVDMRPSFDDTMEEPIILPAKFPMVLLNGTAGIGYTVSTNVPPYNLNEIADATIKLIQNPDAQIRLIPDSPTGCGIMVNDKKPDSFAWIATAQCDPENYTITFTHLPYHVFLNDIDDRIRQIMKSSKPIQGIIQVSHDSDMMDDKIAYTIICKPGSNVYKILGELYNRVSGLKSSFSASNLLVVDIENELNEIKKYDVRKILLSWISNRRITKMRYFQRMYTYKLIEIQCLKGKVFMLSEENLDKTIKVVRETRPSTQENIIKSLVDAYDGQVTSAQAKIVADLRLANISLEERDNTIKKIEELMEEVADILNKIQTPDMLDKVIIEELSDIKSKYGYPRRSKILKSGVVNINSKVGAIQLMKDGSFILTEEPDAMHKSSDIFITYDNSVTFIDEFGNSLYVKDVTTYPTKVPFTMDSLSEFKTKFGKCIYAVTHHDLDVLVLTNKGNVKRIIGESFKTNYPKTPVCRNFMMFDDPDERIVSVMEVAHDTADDILIYTDEGLGRRVALQRIHSVMSLKAKPQSIMPSNVNTTGMFVINNNKPYVIFITRQSRVRKNKLKWLSRDKGKLSEDLQQVIPLDDGDKLMTGFCCNDNAKITLYHNNDEATEIQVVDMPCVTLGTSPVKISQVVTINATLID